MVLVPFKFQGIFCNKISTDDEKVKLYTNKEVVFIEISISKFHKQYYFPVIEKLVLYLDRLQILG